jgi:hypothetical protein
METQTGSVVLSVHDLGRNRGGVFELLDPIVELQAADVVRRFSLCVSEVCFQGLGRL